MDFRWRRSALVSSDFFSKTRGGFSFNILTAQLLRTTRQGLAGWTVLNGLGGHQAATKRARSIRLFLLPQVFPSAYLPLSRLLSDFFRSASSREGRFCFRFPGGFPCAPVNPGSFLSAPVLSSKKGKKKRRKVLKRSRAYQALLDRFPVPRGWAPGTGQKNDALRQIGESYVKQQSSCWRAHQPECFIFARCD